MHFSFTSLKKNNNSVNDTVRTIKNMTYRRKKPPYNLRYIGYKTKWF